MAGLNQVVYKLAAAVALAAGLTGCANTLTTNVSNFNQWPSNAQGATYTIVPAPESSSWSELERKTYEGYVAQRLQQQGLRPAAQAAAARMVVDMQVQSRREKVRVTTPTYVPAPYYGPWGWRYDDYWCDDGWMARRVGSMCLVERTTVQAVDVHQLQVRIRDRSQKGAGAGAPAVFESKAEYVGQAPLSSVMSYLVASVFDQFPGKNGEVHRVQFDTDTGLIKKR